MAVHKITLRRGRRELGHIDFDLHSAKSGVGEVKRVHIPSDILLETQLIKVLEENPDGLVVIGGIIPTELGRYSDGVYVAVESLAKQFKYTFNASDIPWPQTSGDVYD
jgi:hypothetical protein